jgi:hypothetical protein
LGKKRRRKRKGRRSRQIKKSAEEAEFEEVVVSCANCGRRMKVIKVRGLDTEGMLCQSCGTGEIKIDFE